MGSSSQEMTVVLASWQDLVFCGKTRLKLQGGCSYHVTVAVAITQSLDIFVFPRSKEGSRLQDRQ